MGARRYVGGGRLRLLGLRSPIGAPVASWATVGEPVANLAAIAPEGVRQSSLTSMSRG